MPATLNFIKCAIPDFIFAFAIFSFCCLTFFLFFVHDFSYLITYVLEDTVFFLESCTYFDQISLLFFKSVLYGIEYLSIRLSTSTSERANPSPRMANAKTHS